MCNYGRNQGPWDDFARSMEEFGENLRDWICGPGPRPWHGEDTSYRVRFHGPVFHGMYPRVNFFIDTDKSLNFEFLLPGFDLKDISLSFSGDSMILSAKRPAANEYEGRRWEFQGFRLRDIDKREFPVPAARFDQAAVSAALRNGILSVRIPAKPESEESPGVKIDIVSG